MKKLALLFLIFSNQVFAVGYGRFGVDGDQVMMSYVAVTALLFLVGYSPEIKKYIKQRFLHKENHSH